MDLSRIVVNVLFAYVVLHVLVRLSGKRAIRHASPFAFALSVIMGDLLDDMVWSEVAPAEFLTAAISLFVTHWAMDYFRYRVTV
jgi:uncharacterized membrane protein YcaP (DUF421 family)